MLRVVERHPDEVELLTSACGTPPVASRESPAAHAACRSGVTPAASVLLRCRSGFAAEALK